MKGFVRLTWVELKLFARDPFAGTFALAMPLITFVLLAAVFGNDPEEVDEDGVLAFRGVGGADYYMVASIALVMAAAGLLSLPVRLASYREQGVLRRFRASGVPAWALLGSQLVIGIVVGAIGSAVMVGVAIPLYGTQGPEQIPGVMAAYLLATVSFTVIGFLLGGVLRTARAAQGIGLILFFVSWMVCGTGPPRAVLPEGVSDFSLAFPLTHAVIVLQDPWWGYGWAAPHLVALAAFMLASAVLSQLLFRWD